MDGASPASSQSKMMIQLQMLKQANQIPAEMADKLIKQTVNQVKAAIGSGNPNGTIDIKA